MKMEILLALPTIISEQDTAIKILAGVFTAGVAAVTWLGKALWKKSESTEIRLTKKLDECEEKHKEATDQAIKTSRALGLLEGRLNEQSGQVIALHKLHSDALMAVRKVEGNELG